MIGGTVLNDQILIKYLADLETSFSVYEVSGASTKLVKRVLLPQ
jgi:hypothetical protein